MQSPDFRDIPYPILEYGHPSLERRTSALSSDEVRQIDVCCMGWSGLNPRPLLECQEQSPP